MHIIWEICLIKGCFSTQNHIYMIMFSISCLLQWPWIWSTCHKHFPVFSSFMIYRRVCIKSTMTGSTSGAGTPCPSGAPEFTPVFSGFRVAQFFVFCVMFCRLLFVLLSFFWFIVLSSSIYRLWLPLWYLQLQTLLT